MPEEMIKELKQIGFMLSPKISYDGDVILSDKSSGEIFFDFNIDEDILVLNSNSKNGKNLYKDFVKKYFINQIGCDVSFLEGALIPKIIIGYDADAKKRRPYFTYMFSLVRLIEDSNLLSEADFQSENDLANVARDHLREVRRRMIDVCNSWKASPYYGEVSARLNANGLPMTKDYVNKQKDGISKIFTVLRGIRSCIERKPFNIDEFLACFDYEKLCMVFCKSVVELSKEYEANTGQIANALSEVLSYINMIEHSNLRDYNPKIKYFNKSTGRVEKYSFSELKSEVKELVDKHPEFKIVEVDMKTIEKHNLDSDPDKLEDFIAKYASILGGEGLSVNWEVIRKGEKDVSLGGGRKPVDRPYTKKEKDAEAELRKKLSTFSGTDYIIQIVGREKFSGYIGFIYKNGLVAFEKFYDEKDPSLPNTGSNATYIMTIDNFLEFSKLSKQDIIEYIKRTDNPDVKRIYHTKTWEDRLLKVLQGKDYSEEVEGLIDALVASGKLTDTRKMESK